MKTGYACDNCNGFTTLRSWIFGCFVCEKEICESCMFGYGVCKECAVKYTEKELEQIWSNYIE